MKQLKSFSLAEVIVTLLILSVGLVALAPLFLKKTSIKDRHYEIYSYTDSNNAKNNVCYQTSVSDGSSTETYIETNKCSEYAFTVPTGVNYIDLTLVAGGGGGGGAAGGKTIDKEAHIVGASIMNGASTTDVMETINLYTERMKNFKINYMSGYGEAGEPFSERRCLYGGTYCAPRSGRTSPALVDFEWPSFLIGGYRHIASIRAPKQVTIKLVDDQTIRDPYSFSVQMFETDYSTNMAQYWINGFGDERGEDYALTSGTTDAYFGCSYGDVSLFQGSEQRGNSFFEKCHIPMRNYRQGYGAEYGSFVYSGYSVANKQPLLGGVPHSSDGQALGYGTCGQGGIGESGIFLCPDNASICSVNNATPTALLNVDGNEDWTKMYFGATKGEPGCIYTSWVEEDAGGTGGGGAGGTMVKIKRLKVTPGQTYYVRVGAGGTGGKGGYTSSNPTNGSDGTGGVSSAIYDSSGNVIYMVNGGAQGIGGKYSTSTGTPGAIGQSGRNVPKLFTSSTYSSIATPTLDTNYVNYVTNGGSYVTNTTGYPSSVDNSYTKLLNYPIFNVEPYKTIDRNGAATKSSTDYTHGGFSGYERTNWNNVVSGSSQVSNDTYDNNHNFGSINGRQNGFWYTKQIDSARAIAYVGGLGGFTGFGGRAGCGGYFNGDQYGCGNWDFDGTNCVNSDLSACTGDGCVKMHTYRETIYTNSEEGTFARSFPYTAHKVAHYFEGCVRDEHNNGATATYQKPDPKSGNYGSGGTGGGGGGYSIKLGGGSGAAGQAGFVVIEYVK